MALSRELKLLAVGFTNGRVTILSWPRIPNFEGLKYDLILQTAAITDVKFSYSSRYLSVSTDDGNLYVLETYRITDGIERQWAFEN